MVGGSENTLHILNLYPHYVKELFTSFQVTLVYREWHVGFTTVPMKRLLKQQ